MQVGGATALIGDPTGKRADRPLLAEATVAANARSIAESVERLFSSHALPEHLTRNVSTLTADASTADADAAATSPVIHPAMVVNNLDFYRDMSVIAFMRDVGRFARMSTMLNKESVQSRLGGKDSSSDAAPNSGDQHGLSFTEFSYQLFQAYDYWRLSEEAGCVLQVGGSDQWGNITAGIDLVRRRRAHAPPADADGSNAAADAAHPADAPVHGLTVPLLTGADGAKWGKSAGNVPVWLDERRTSHHALYQYLLGTSDADAPSLLRRLTLLPDELVDSTLAEHAAAPHRKLAQRALADGVTEIVRGSSAVQVARRCAGILFAGSAAWSDVGTAAASVGGSSKGGVAAAGPAQMQAGDLLTLAASGDLPAVWLTDADVTGSTGNGSSSPAAAPAAGASDAKTHSPSQLAVGLPELLVRGGLSPSRNEARRTIAAGGLQVNGVRWVAPPAAAVPAAAAMAALGVDAAASAGGDTARAGDADAAPKGKHASGGKGSSDKGRPAAPQVPTHLNSSAHFIDRSVCLLALGARKRLIVVLPGSSVDPASASAAPSA